MVVFMDAYRSVKNPADTSRVATLNRPELTGRTWNQFWDGWPGNLDRLQEFFQGHLGEFLQPFTAALGADFVENNLLFDFSDAYFQSEEDNDSLEPNEFILEVALYPKGTDPLHSRARLSLFLTEDLDTGEITSDAPRVTLRSTRPYVTDAMEQIITKWDEQVKAS